MDVLVTLFYLLFATCIIYPPTEFVSAGFTIAQLFQGFLGSENTDFVRYHIRRSVLTALVHACLPLGYLASLWAAGWSAEGALAAALLVPALTAPLLALHRAFSWASDEWRHHPTARALAPYADPARDWKSVANSVNEEFRSVDKISIPMTGTSKLVVTSGWIMKVSQYTVEFVQQSEATLVATKTDTHELSMSGAEEGAAQFVSLEVRGRRGGARPIRLRLNALRLPELHTYLQRPVVLPPTIAIRTSLVHQFVDVFRAHVQANPVFYVDEELEQCIGCMSVPADVKLHKRCEDAPPPPEGAAPPLDDAPALLCSICRCRPMWCCGCMGAWWASRQDAGARDTWLAARCTCPVCRARFCLLDVCPASPRPTLPSDTPT